MPARGTAPQGAPCWIDLQSSDTARSREFYGRLFGWTASAPSEEFGGYLVLSRNDVPVAGLMASDAQAPVSDVWSVYLATDDVAKTLAAVSDTGGQVIVPPMTVGDLGTMAFVLDAAGAGVGLWQADQFPGFGVLDEPGTPGWFELHSRDHDAAVGFYREAIGWDTRVASDTPQFRYTTMRDPGADAELAGIMDAAAMLPDGAPSLWSVYFAVEDVDAAMATVVELGGEIVMPAEDTPHGRLAQVTDATGAGFKLVGPNVGTPQPGGTG
jgi:predicted enzyme related to lactoylglutathione lyase